MDVNKITMTDQEIIDSIKEGRDEKALLKLYQFFPSIQKFLLNTGASKDEALDIYQDALFLLCKKVRQGDFKLSARLSTYLFGVAKFLWKEELLKKNKHVALDFDLPQEELLELKEQEQKMNLAEKVLNELGEKCLQILQAFYQEGLRMESIASRFGFGTEKSAKNQKYKCLERAKLKYQELAIQTLSK